MTTPISMEAMFPMSDPISSGRYTQAYAIVPNDTTPVVATSGEAGTRAFMCVVAGNVTARFNKSATPVTFPVLAGVVYPFGCNIIYAATTATLIGLN
jgi:hypothetical protein